MMRVPPVSVRVVGSELSHEFGVFVKGESEPRYLLESVQLAYLVANVFESGYRESIKDALDYGVPIYR